MSWISENPKGVTISILVSPRASRTEVQGEHGEFLKVRLAAPPVEGAANEELIEFLARKLSVRKTEISLVSGPTSKRKVLFISSITAKLVQARLCGR